MSELDTFFPAGETIPGLLERRAAQRPDHPHLRLADEIVTSGDLNARVNRAVHGLMEAGLKGGDFVAMMLHHHLEHVIVFFALMKLGAVQIPINTQLKGAGLAYMLDHATPIALIADIDLKETVEAALPDRPLRLIWRGERAGGASLSDILAHPQTKNPPQSTGSDLRTILYTSGTTGPAKGVEVTDQMFRAAALSSIWLGDIQPASVLHFWDPIYHVFGSEVLVLTLLVPVTLALFPRFSATRFWDEARSVGATHVHFVGGVLQLLLKQPPSEADRRHGVRIAWGGGCPKDIWREFETRFGIEIREGYGMTETSSFSVINKEARTGSIGRAVDFFEVEIVTDDGLVCPPGERGEVRVREKVPGVMTRRYHKNPEATANTIRGGWLYTGDLAYTDDDGFIFFLGRKKDSLRRRGENISAWEVESVINEHPDVEECALIGVKNEIGDEDLKIFVKRRAGSALEAAALLTWCEPRMARFQIPRFVQFVEEFRKTPTQRIQKGFLSDRIDDGCFDRERVLA